MLTLVVKVVVCLLLYIFTFSNFPCRNGVPVRPDGHQVQVSADGTLTLYNVQTADEGSYTCNAYAGTHAVSATAEIRVTKGIAFPV